MNKRVAVILFLAVLACLWLAPQAQAQYMPCSSWGWQRCNTPPGYYDNGYYGYYRNYRYPRYRSYRRGYYPYGYGMGIVEAVAPVASYEAALLYEEHLQKLRSQEFRRQETQEQSREKQVPHDLIPMTNTTDFPAIVYDGEVEIARFQPRQTRRLPEPKEGYEAKIRTIIGNRVEWLQVRVRDNDSQSGWEIVFAGKK